MKLMLLYAIILSAVSDAKLYLNVIIGMTIAFVILFTAIIVMRKRIKTLRLIVNTGDNINEEQPIKPKVQEKIEIEAVIKAKPKIGQNKLPDPGLIFKYSLAEENTLEKMITIGQKEGSIKTYSTEIIDNHLSIFIRILDNKREKDIYDLPDQITEEYMIDLRRDSKLLYYYEGMEGFKPMPSKLRIYLKEKPDEMGDPTFKTLDPKQPIRFRLGDRLNSDDKFINGFFEFHLFNKEYKVKTTSGIPKTEKNFFIRLYKVYPGYDTGNVSDEGLYPMIDPFKTA